jgi:hypothetical protein
MYVLRHAELQRSELRLHVEGMVITGSLSPG